MPQVVANILIAAATYGHIALSFWLIYRVNKFFHLAHGAAAILGGYSVHFLMRGVFSGLPLVSEVLLGALISLLAGAAFGLVTDLLIYSHLKRRRANELTKLLASFGWLSCVQAAIALAAGSRSISLSSGHSYSRLQAGGVTVTPIHLGILVSTITLSIGVWHLMSRTRLGTSLEATSEDPISASLVGIDADATIRWSLVIGSAVAGYGGWLVGLDTGLHPYMGFNLLLKGVVAMIAGGGQSILGVLGGCLLLSGLENGVTWILPSIWKDTVAFALLILILMIKRRGVTGSVQV